MLLASNIKAPVHPLMPIAPPDLSRGLLFGLIIDFAELGLGIIEFILD